MRETLSLLRWHTWARNIPSGHYFRLIRMWGWKAVIGDTVNSARWKCVACWNFIRTKVLRRA
jgi:uncharacterized Fe-S cluster-containing radical SAM superfamily protein